MGGGRKGREGMEDEGKIGEQETIGERMKMQKREIKMGRQGWSREENARVKENKKRRNREEKKKIELKANRE